MSNKLYIGKVKDVNKSELQKLVQSFGLIKSFEDKDNFCFVEFQYESDARIAQYELDGKTVGQNRIVVQFSKGTLKQEDLLKESLPSQTKKIYIGNLNHKFTSQDLGQMFSRFGKILDVIFKDTYALIEYPYQQNATEAVLYMNDKQVKGEILKVDLQKTYDEVISSSNRIHVGKIGSLKKTDLILHFGQFGFIDDISVKEDLYAFIQYRNNLQASKAIKEMNGAEIKGNKIQVQEARGKKQQQKSQAKNHLPVNFPIAQLNHLNQMTTSLPFNSVVPSVKQRSRSRSKSKEKRQSQQQEQQQQSILQELKL